MAGAGWIAPGRGTPAQEFLVPRHIACMTFDFDAMSGFIARGMVTPTPISRGEFGVVGVQRILDLLERYALCGTFFVPGTVIETYPAVCEAIVAGGHEVGHHGWTHVPPASLPREEEAAGLARANASIERLCGRRARGYRSPSWDLGPHTIELLLEQGFVYDSSMMGHDHSPYRARVGDDIRADEPCRFGTPVALLEMPISWTLDDYPHFEFVRTPTSVLPGLADARGVLENWVEDFLYMKESTAWGVLTYTCHPFVIGRGHRMRMLERLVVRLLHEGAAFLTVEEAAEEFLRRERAEDRSDPGPS
jgi:peptidoglycan/xylan/chitin deacetylase (PgdA/CDA1 family)